MSLKRFLNWRIGISTGYCSANFFSPKAVLENFSRSLPRRLEMNEIVTDEELSLAKSYFVSERFNGLDDGPFGRSFGGEIVSFALEKLKVRLDIYC
jgi:hypothetical protein